ncbi:MAG: hypothetical protein PWR14_742 [Thermosediminibacterales bacterium]|jgi:hypothetical protein|nr:hypothetical protein [Thermosediminibacterales bacterium]
MMELKIKIIISTTYLFTLAGTVAATNPCIWDSFISPKSQKY